MNSHQLLLLIGGFGLYMVEASYLPQIWRLFKLKEADEFSFLFPSLNIAGRLCGLCLSIANGSALFGWFFVVGIVLRAVLLSQVIYYRSHKRANSKEEVPAAREMSEMALAGNI